MRVAVAALVAPHHDVIGPLERAQAEVTILRRVEDLAELLAVARTGSVDVLLASAEVEEITRALIDEVDSLDRPVGLVVQSEVPAERKRLRRLGVPALRLDADPLELAAALTQAARDAALETKRTPLPDAEGEPELPARLDVDADEPRPLDPGESGAVLPRQCGWTMPRRPPKHRPVSPPRLSRSANRRTAPPPPLARRRPRSWWPCGVPRERRGARLWR